MNLHMCAKFGVNRSSRLTASTYFWICDPLKPPEMPLWVKLYLAYVHSQTNPPTYTKFVANRCSRLTASPNFWIGDPLPPPPQMPPGVLRGDLYLAYVHSQINPQTWTKDGANRSRLLTASQTFECLTPKTPPSAPLVSWGAICLAYIHFQMDLQMCVKFGANRSSCLTASPDLWICDTLTLPQMPPGVLRGDLYLAYVHSQMNPQTWTKVGAHRTASPDFWIVDPLKKPSDPPRVSRGNLFDV